MPFAVVFKNNMLDAVPPDNMSLHTANPGSTGTSEVPNTGSPAYARKGVTWAGASAGSKPLNGTLPVFDVPASTSVVAVGFWRSGVYQGYVTVTTETFAAQGTYTITSGTIDLNNTASA